VNHFRFRIRARNCVPHILQYSTICAFVAPFCWTSDALSFRPVLPFVRACVRAWPAGAFYDRLAVDSTSGFRNLVRLAQRLRKLQLFLPRIALLFSENFTASDTTVDRIQITGVAEVHLMQYNVIFRPFSSSFCISSTGRNNRPIYEKVLQRASNIRTAARVGIGLHTVRERA